MLCLCDYIINILYSLLKRLTKLSKHHKRESVRKTYFCFQHHTPQLLFVTSLLATPVNEDTIHLIFRVSVQSESCIPNENNSGSNLIINIVRYSG
jgi:hypothetical protein